MDVTLAIAIDVADRTEVLDGILGYTQPVEDDMTDDEWGASDGSQAGAKAMMDLANS